MFRAAVRIAAHTWLCGAITFVLPSGAKFRSEAAARPGRPVVIQRLPLHARGSWPPAISASAKAIMAGEWDTPDLSVVLECVQPSISIGCRAARTATSPMRMINASPICCTATAAPARSATSSPLRPRQRLLRALARPHDDLFVRPVRADGPAARARPSGTSTRPGRGRSGSAPTTTCWRSAAAGAASPSSRPARSAPGSPASPSRRAQYEFARERLFEQGPGRTRRHPAGRLSRRRGPVRPRRLDRDVRGGGRGILADLLRQDPRRADAGRPRRPADHHHPRRAVRRLSQRAPTSSRSTSSRAACCPRETRLKEETARRRARVARASSASARTMPTPCAEWARRFESGLGRDPRPRLRRALPPAVALLPGLLRGRLPHRADQRGAAQPGQELRCPRQPRRAGRRPGRRGAVRDRSRLGRSPGRCDERGKPRRTRHASPALHLLRRPDVLVVLRLLAGGAHPAPPLSRPAADPPGDGRPAARDDRADAREGAPQPGAPLGRDRRHDRGDVQPRARRPRGLRLRHRPRRTRRGAGPSHQRRRGRSTCSSGCTRPSTPKVAT